MALTVLHNLSKNLASTPSCVMSVRMPKEQMVICIRWIGNKNLEDHEDAIGFYLVANICTATITKSIKDVLLQAIA